MQNDWFRKATWTPKDQADFYERLSRASSRMKPQYLHIQGLSLCAVGSEYRQDALALFDQTLQNYPEDVLRANVFTSKADCLVQLGRVDEAASAYLDAINQMRKVRNVQSNAPVSYAWLVALNRLERHYETALDCLEEFGRDNKFPVEQFRRHASRALILDSRKEPEAARAAARLALDEVLKDDSGFHHHRTLGLVDDQFKDVRAALLAMMSGNN